MNSAQQSHTGRGLMRQDDWQYRNDLGVGLEAPPLPDYLDGAFVSQEGDLVDAGRDHILEPVTQDSQADHRKEAWSTLVRIDKQLGNLQPEHIDILPADVVQALSLLQNTLDDHWKGAEHA